MLRIRLSGLNYFVIFENSAFNNAYGFISIIKTKLKYKHLINLGISLDNQESYLYKFIRKFV
ncbi:hypothetical protein T07_6036 [Trichinella nelsoni]|uniref:Uncharacterized protein n=1 Tax=Trichinella nelsoni TaxID=6336 RepID=A0A0V0S2N4_9BILA|nr:hypothetical protein T07_6036 [Trichinella nelsoni]